MKVYQRFHGPSAISQLESNADYSKGISLQQPGFWKDSDFRGSKTKSSQLGVLQGWCFEATKKMTYIVFIKWLDLR